MKHVTLAGGGVWLSVPTEDDIPAITACCQEPSIAQMTSSIPVPFAEADARHFVTTTVGPEWAEGTALHWAIRQSENGELVGMVALHGRKGYSPTRRYDGGFAFGEVELGYWLSSAVRSRGLMTRSARLVCAFGFDELGLLGVEWRALAGNVPSARVARRLGFRFTGIEPTDTWRGRPAELWAARLVSEQLRGSDEEPWPEGWPSEAAAGPVGH